MVDRIADFAISISVIALTMKYIPFEEQLKDFVLSLAEGFVVVDHEVEIHVESTLVVIGPFGAAAVVDRVAPDFDAAQFGAQHQLDIGLDEIV